MAVLLGLGHVDRQVEQGKQYYYELRGIDAGGAEVVLATNIQIRTGVPVNVPPPQDVQAIAGDRRVLIHWRESSVAAGFIRDFSNSYLGAFYVRDRGYMGLNYFLGGVFVASLEGGLARGRHAVDGARNNHVRARGRGRLGFLQRLDFTVLELVSSRAHGLVPPERLHELGERLAADDDLAAAALRLELAAPHTDGDPVVDRPLSHRDRQRSRHLFQL